MRFRVVVSSALVALAAVVPTATARPLHVTHAGHAQAAQGEIATGVATAIAAEIANAGIKAGVAEWAPEYSKYVDPTAYGIAQIQAQLAELNNKLNDLIAAQDALGAKLSCEIQQSSVSHDLADVQAWYATLLEQRYVPSVSSRQSNLAHLYGQRTAMHSAQIHIHNALVGIGVPSLLQACGKAIERAMAPYMSPFLGFEMHRLYQIYNAASAELLVVRVNMMALHPDDFPARNAETAAGHLEAYWAEEQGSHFIKPIFRSTSRTTRAPAGCGAHTPSPGGTRRR